MPPNSRSMFLFALTIFASAFLLFLVQPIIAKQILPWFGGTAAVWSTCLVFFQLTLLAGYVYSDWVTRRLNIRQQAMLHLALIAVALALLPIVPNADLQPKGHEQPSLRILLLLTATIGLPYFLLSTTSPLVQAWFARVHPGKSPYRLFALSNLASMLALLSYPFLLEPAIATRRQAMLWSIGFGVFAVLIALTLWQTQRANNKLETETSPASPLEHIPTFPAASPTQTDKWIWIALAALGSSLLLGVSNHLTQNIPSAPLLWVVPLAIYLLTFTLCFNAPDGVPSWYPRSISLPQTALAICAMAWLLADRKLDFMLLLHIIVFCGGLFIACMYCHSELAARKPAPQFLTNYYLMIAAGGAVGSFLIGIVAPLTLSAHYELGLTIYVFALLATWLLWRDAHRGLALIAGAVCLFTLSAAMYSMYHFRQEVIVMTRNFYGTLRVRESHPDEMDRKRTLVHGGIMHGDQYLDPERRRIATSYFRPTSGIGIALQQKNAELDRPLRVGIVGLGTGTLAAYGEPGDVFRFYEINPGVVDIAQRDFTYLADTAATVEIALGDARLNLEREPAQRFDILAIDAFSSDSIPVHLLTVEALAAYEKHIQPDGIIAFHISNRFLQLHPVVEQLATARSLTIAWLEETRDDGSTVSDWMLVSKDPMALAKPSVADAAQPIPTRPEWQLWTDDFNNIVQVLR
jgi:hypothetical protein